MDDSIRFYQEVQQNEAIEKELKNEHSNNDFGRKWNWKDSFNSQSRPIAIVIDSTGTKSTIF